MVLGLLSMLGPACTNLQISTLRLNSSHRSVFSALRVYALSGQHKALAGLTMCLAVVPIVVNAVSRPLRQLSRKLTRIWQSTEYQSHPENFEPPYNCALDSTTPPSVALA